MIVFAAIRLRCGEVSDQVLLLQVLEQHGGKLRGDAVNTQVTPSGLYVAACPHR